MGRREGGSEGGVEGDAGPGMEELRGAREGIKCINHQLWFFLMITQVSVGKSYMA